ncbi:type IV toxin-antitoxin system AbiEi family antitoxin [Sphingobacterium cavernae]|uniref:type IV toxin-antitoxin system AbiEi family antitoxin n=1 Tax=Sphingobacterium cavernae TaxID=2592657 RepID=UPI00122FBE3F|nr:type IV toxin-antitoxin system AbiEi family antitoxin [Sphingobacterium cavernae]
MYKDNDYIYEAIASLEDSSKLTIEFYSNRGEYDGIVDIEGEQFYMFARKDARLIHANLIVNEIINHPNYKTTKNYIVVSDFIANESKEVFKNNKINYLDTSGNAFIFSKKLRVFIEGRKKSRNEVNNSSAKIFQEAGIKLIYVLLTNPEASKCSLRELAAKAGIALGSVSNIMKELEEENFIIKTSKERKLKNREELLQKWVAAYNEVLKPKLFRKAYQIKNARDLVMNNSIASYEIGGELAAAEITNYLKPRDYEIYYSDELIDFSKLFKLIPDTNGNLKIYNKFWVNETDTNINRIASKLLIYADLMGTNNDRNRETAQIILDKGL